MTNALEEVLPLEIYTVLKGEHHEVSLLFKALEASPEAMEEGRASLFKKLRRELMSHAKAEETVVYERVRAKTSHPDLIQPAKREHEGMVHLMDMIYSMDPATNTWMEKVMTLKEMVEQHVREEETTFFEEMKLLFNEEESRAMAEAFHTEKTRELEAIA